MDQRILLIYRFKSPGSYFMKGLTPLDVSGLFSENRATLIQHPVNKNLGIDDEQQ